MQVTVELKNDLAINGTLHSVDQYMNIKLDNVKVVNEDRFPHMVCTPIHSDMIMDTCNEISLTHAASPN
jgi:small nuclear ribonucleoprotein (snRNP)-like protein